MLQTLTPWADCVADDGRGCTLSGLEPGWIEPTVVEHRASLRGTMLSKVSIIEV